MKLGHYFSAAILGSLGPATVLTLLAATTHAQFTFSDVADEASLVALWELNEPVGSGTVADINSTYTGTVSGGTTLGVSSAMTTLGTAALFNGSSGKIDVAHAMALNPQSYTIQAWAQVRGGTGSYRSPLTSRHDSPAQGYIFYAASNNNWEFWGGPGWTVTPGPAVILNQWVHLAATYDNDSRVRVLYLNGHPVATASGTTLQPNSASPLRIGAGGTEGAGSYWFNGAVDNVAVLSDALAHQNIANHYNAKSNYAVQVAADGPVAYWRLGEQAGTSAYNALNVTAHTGTYSNVALRQMATPIGNDVDTAASFAHASAQVAIPNHANINPAESFTIEAWARVDGGQGSFRSVLTSRATADGGSQGFIFYASSANKWSFWNGTGSSTSWHSMDGPDVVVGQWVHLAGTYDAAAQTKTFFVDGRQVASATGISYAPNTFNGFFIGMGGNVGTDFPFNGLIDEVAVFGRALAPSAVNRHFLAASTGADVIHWVGDDGNLLWSTQANWTQPGNPVARIVVLDNTAASLTPGAITNSVDASYAVASLIYENSGAYHTTEVQAGSTLTLAAASGTPRIFVAEAARIDGQLAGSQGIAKFGGGTLTLGGTGGAAMNIGGTGVTVAEGTLRLNREDLSFDTGVFHANTPIRVESGATLEIANKWNLRQSNVITVDRGTLRFTHTLGTRDDSENYLNTLHLIGATVTGHGIRLGNDSNALFTVAGNAGTTISTPLLLVNSGGNPRTLTLDVADGAATNDLIMSGRIYDYPGRGPNRVVKTGPGTLRLDSKLDYTGEAVVDAGTLILNLAGALAAGNTGQFGAPGHIITVNSGATLQTGQAWTLGDGLQHHIIVDGGTIDFRSSTYQGSIELTGGAITTVAADNPWRTGLYGNALITVNPSSVASTISGLLCFVKSGSLGQRTVFDVADGPAEHDLIVSSTIFDHTGNYGGMVLVKDGPGTMVLSGANTFVGGVSLDAGKLLVNNTAGSGTGTGPVTVNSGGTLGGAGTIAGATTVKTGGTLATGTSIGTLTFGNSLTLEDGAVWDWEFVNNTPGNYDQAVGPNLILPTEGTITLNIWGLEDHTVGWYDEFTIFTGEVENFNAGLFQLENHSDWTRGWRVSVGNSLVLMAVPEPGTWLLLLSAFIGGLLVRRR
ncbi:MAG: LamG-like jellyroll fold domain-containing protein [Thermoguttaceae bacterium]|jgi:autotransporter-associated beta strand protein|nr:LamG-like jellyroll fold domain-containing protein [Thermoguttaceae bacterium]